MYLELFETAVIDSVFTDGNKTAVAADAITVIKTGIIDTILLTSTADRTVVSPIVNHMFLFENFGTPTRKFPIWSSATFTAVLDAIITSNATSVVIKFNIVLVFVDCNMFTVLDFDDLSISGPVWHINTGTVPSVVVVVVVGGGGGATGVAPSNFAQVIAATVVATNAANQILITNQTTAALALPTTIPTNFNSNNLPAEAKARYTNYLDPTYLMTYSDMQPFSTPLGGVCPVLF